MMQIKLLGGPGNGNKIDIQGLPFNYLMPVPESPDDTIQRFTGGIDASLLPIRSAVYERTPEYDWDRGSEIVNAVYAYRGEC